MGRMVQLLFTLCLLSCAGGTLLAQEEAATECPSTIAISDTAELFASIRRFEGVDPADFAAINHYAGTEFLPLLKEAPGFRFYATMNDEETRSGAAVNVFTSEEEMQAANALASEHIAESLAALLPNAPEVFSGPVQLLIYANHCPEQGMDEADSDVASETDLGEELPSAYLSYRVYTEIDDLEANLPWINELVREKFAPVYRSAESLILYLYFTLSPPEEGAVALNIFASQEEMSEVNDHTAQLVAAEFSEIVTGPPAFYGGSIAVLDLSGLFSEEAMEEMSEEMEED